MNKIPKRVHTFSTFWRGFAEMLRPSPEQRARMRSGRVGKSFREEIELVVSRVNGCRTCTYVHSANALREGLSDKELEELLALDLGHFPVERAVAFAFAQHYAESGGRPDPAAEQRFRDYYGSQRSQDILAYLRFIQFSSVTGATIQALLSRLRGQPVPGSNLLTELVVFMISAPGYLPRLAWMEHATAYGRVRNAMSQAE
ncbi:MAG: carboxymuconolactone decarboxylase family protein [Verrucomicrobiales bacterium]|nr:carboxymuconolactone decarboxylase family protein [Verrucomicrobiales bacterium]